MFAILFIILEALAFVSDTVGDPFKDTVAPSLKVLLKLMTIVSIVFADVVLKYGITIFFSTKLTVAILIALL
ncbi:hypothetical protein HOH87_03040 [bacterium]|nr:hypothetical protein [bacterium]